ncbi:hypothetical protein SGPA1_12606 [Streptomyces misionensis JCM 4497]
MARQGAGGDRGQGPGRHRGSDRPRQGLDLHRHLRHRRQGRPAHRRQGRRRGRLPRLPGREGLRQVRQGHGLLHPPGQRPDHRQRQGLRRRGHQGRAGAGGGRGQVGRSGPRGSRGQRLRLPFACAPPGGAPSPAPRR